VTLPVAGVSASPVQGKPATQAASPAEHATIWVKDPIKRVRARLCLMNIERSYVGLLASLQKKAHRWNPLELRWNSGQR
jgi:hypothetical protein